VRKATGAKVRRLIARLPESLRTLLVLRDLEELETAATALALGLTRGAVKIRRHRAPQALRSLLDDQMKRSLTRPDAKSWSS